jgi:hypothetical protein
MFIIRAGEGGAPSWGLPPRGLATRFFLRHSGEKGILQLCGGRVLQPCGEGELLLPGQGAAVRAPPGRRSCRAWAGHVQVLPAPSAAPGVAQHVVRHEGGTCVLGRYRSHSCGKNGSEDLPVRFGAAAARWCGVGGQVATVVGAEVVVAIGEAASAEAVASVDETVSATCAPGLWLFGFNGWFSSPVMGREQGPSSGSDCPEAIAAAV